MKRVGDVRNSGMRICASLLALFVATCVVGSAAHAEQDAQPNPYPHQALKDYLKAKGGKIGVTIEGTVANQLDTPDDSQRVRGYNLRDVKGVLIIVRTTKPLPSPDTRLRVTGVAMVDREPPYRNTPYVLEEIRSIVDPRPEYEDRSGSVNLEPMPKFKKPGAAGTTPASSEPDAGVAADGGAGISSRADRPVPGPTGNSETGGADSSGAGPVSRPAEPTGFFAALSAMPTGWVVALSVLGLGFIGGAVALVLTRRQSPVPSWQAPRPVSPLSGPDPTDLLRPTPSSPAPSPALSPAPEVPVLEDYKTVKSYKTSKTLPGRLVVLDDKRETDTIFLSDQNGRGEIEIGRDSPDAVGGIRIKDKTNTLSRRQAKLLYDSSRREFKLLNLIGDAGNPTTHNDRVMHENEAIVLKEGDVLGMGNVELLFKQK